MSKPKIHMLYDGGFRMANDPVESSHHAMCVVYQTAHLNPDTTTWVKAEVTCRGCRNRLIGVRKATDSMWETWLEENEEKA